MTENTGNVYEPFSSLEQQKKEEIKKIKKSSNVIGAAFIVLWLMPDILNSLLSDILKIIGPTPEAVALFGDPAFMMVMQTIYSLLMFTLPFLILPIGHGKKISEFAFIRKPRRKLFLPFVFIGVGISAFANLATNKLGAIFQGFGIEFYAPDINFPEGVFGFILSMLAVAVTPALVEEFATRGMTLSAAKQYGEDFGILVSALLFALMHGNLVQIPFAFIMGIVIGFAVIKTGSVVTGMAIHFLNNAISVSMSYLSSGIESVVVSAVISLAYFVVCALLLFVGIYLAQKSEEGVWRLYSGESTLSAGKKFKYFLLSHAVIASIGLNVIDCICMISLG